MRVTFEGWNGSGIADPNSATTTIQMTEDRNITASFSIKKHSLSVISGEGGNVSGEGNYTHGSTPSIIATPDQGFIFSGWFGDGVTNPDAMTTTVSMTEERIVTGTFTAIEYGLVLNSSIGGSVRGEGNYSHGEVVTITAIPDSGYQFDSWSGDIEGNLSSPSRSFLMESNNSITANFIAVEENHFVLTILSNPQNGGTSTGSGSYLANTSVPISAMPINGYEFVNWTGQGIEDSNSSDSNLVLSESQIITANFQKESFLLHIEIDGEGNATGEGFYEYGTERNITAVPANGYTFYKWEGTGVSNPGSTTTTITISNDLNITAVFKAKEFNLNLPTSTGGQVQGGGIYPYGSVVEISAIPQPGYSFVGWTGGDFHDATAAFTTLTLSEDTNATAQFEPIFYSITVNSSKGGNVFPMEVNLNMVIITH